MLIETARCVNDGMPEYVGKLLLAALDDPQSSSVALLGVAYKGGVADTRQSPALSLTEFLRESGVADLRLTDPYVDQAEHDIVSLRSALGGADAAIIVTDHPEYGALSPGMFAEQMRGRVVVDSRGLLNCSRWEAAGLEIYQI
jgi:UDP-N-acetyl-D-mannosaminuronic acid dehydrogenase